MVVVDGRMQTRPWTDRDGNKRVTTDSVADNAYFGDSKRDADSGGDQPAQGLGTYNSYSDPMPGAVPGDYAPEF